jgi:hypothetical protein
MSAASLNFATGHRRGNFFRNFAYDHGWEPADFYRTIAFIIMIVSFLCFIAYGEMNRDAELQELQDQLEQCPVVGQVALMEDGRAIIKDIHRCE